MRKAKALVVIMVAILALCAGTAALSWALQGHGWGHGEEWQTATAAPATVAPGDEWRHGLLAENHTSSNVGLHSGDHTTSATYRNRHTRWLRLRRFFHRSSP